MCEPQRGPCRLFSKKRFFLVLHSRSAFSWRGSEGVRGGSRAVCFYVASSLATFPALAAPLQSLTGWSLAGPSLHPHCSTQRRSTQRESSTSRTPQPSLSRGAPPTRGAPMLVGARPARETLGSAPLYGLRALTAVYGSRKPNQDRGQRPRQLSRASSH